MSSNSPFTETSQSPTQFGGDGRGDGPGNGLGNGLDETIRTEEAEPLKVQLGEHLDSATRRSLHGVEESSASRLDFLKRNPIPIVLALGGLVWILASQRRRSSKAYD